MSHTFHKGKEKLKEEIFGNLQVTQTHRCETSKPGSYLSAVVTGTGPDAESDLPASGGEWALPPDDGSVGTDAHDVLIPGAYPQARDVATVSNPNVRHFTLIIIPDFDHVVIST